MHESVHQLHLKKYKLVFLGDQAVGKSSIITRFMYGSFDPNYQATIGIDFLSKVINVDGQSMRLQLWDTAGQERFRTLIPSYFRDSAAAIVVYDITNRASFLNTTKWIEDIRAQRGDDVIIFLVGNKSDLENRRQVTEEDVKTLIDHHKVFSVETSAKSGRNVEDLFLQLAAQLRTNDVTSGSPTTTSQVDIQLKPEPPEERKSWCPC